MRASSSLFLSPLKDSIQSALGAGALTLGAVGVGAMFVDRLQALGIISIVIALVLLAVATYRANQADPGRINNASIPAVVAASVAAVLIAAIVLLV